MVVILFGSIIVDPAPVPLEIFTETQVQEALDQLRGVPAYNEVLVLQRLPPKDPSEVLAAQQRESAGQEVLTDALSEVRLVEGSVPPSFESLRDLDTEANQLFGLQTQEDLSKLIWYLNQFDLVPKPVRGTGSCLFASIRRCLDCPVEYTNMHLRRQLVWFLCHNIAFFYNLLIVHVKGNYGHIRLTPQEFKIKEAAGTLTPLEIEEYNEPGPFSIVSYLESLLELSFYGEEIVVAATSMMWQLRITILASDTLQQTRVHHSNKLCNADVVLIRTRQLHYIPAGTFWSHEWFIWNHDG